LPSSKPNPKLFYWHTEGNFDFLGILSPARRAAWRFQFFTRAFAAGIAKVCVMDASPAEQQAVRAYIEALPHPYPMIPATAQMSVVSGQAVAFLHSDGADSPQPASPPVWIIWPVAGTGDAIVEVPVLNPKVTRVTVDGSKFTESATNGKVHLMLPGDKKMAPGILLIDGQAPDQVPVKR